MREAIDSSIAEDTKSCLAGFETLKSSLSDSRNGPTDLGITTASIQDELTRFQIWVGNSGSAQKLPLKSSLEHRVREAPKVRRQILELLGDLEEGLQDACAIASGERPNQVADTSSDEEEFDSEAEKESLDEGTSEIQEIMLLIHDTVSALFRLSVIIQNATPRDRFAKALSSVKVPFAETFDIAHVGHKFPKLDKPESAWLKQRLGRAITQRRQYLRYSRDHREKKAKQFEEEAAIPHGAGEAPKARVPVHDIVSNREKATEHSSKKQPSTLDRTTASTLVVTRLDDDDKASDTAQTETSFATSLGEEESNKAIEITHLHDVSRDGSPFECPYCWTIQSIKRQRSWKKHVFQDLRPYICTFKNCDVKLFSDRRSWSEHEFHTHRVDYQCSFCTHAPYSNKSSFKQHVSRQHSERASDSSIDAIIEACQKPKLAISPSECPFCDDWQHTLIFANAGVLSSQHDLVVTPAQFAKHVSAHMEQLALFAIPRGHEDAGDADSADVAAGGSPSESDEVEIHGKTLLEHVEEGDESGDPPLIFAAKEGLPDEVANLLEEGAVVYQSGAGGDTALHAAARCGHLGIVNLLCENGADPSQANDHGRTPLHLVASSSGHSNEAIINVLIRYGADINFQDHAKMTPVRAAITGSDPSCAVQLILAGAEVTAVDESGNQELHAAAFHGLVNITRLLLENGADVDAKNHEGHTPLSLAISKDVPVGEEVLSLLLSSKASLNVTTWKGKTILIIAIEGEHTSIVRLLLLNGADPTLPISSHVQKFHFCNNCRERKIQCSFRVHERRACAECAHSNLGCKVNPLVGPFYRDPLSCAIMKDNHKIVESLLHTLVLPRWEIDLFNHEYLAMAVQDNPNSTRIIESMLDFGFESNSSDDRRINALHIASECGFKAIVQTLLERGADVNYRDDQGTLAHSLALMHGHTDVAELLVECGSIVDYSRGLTKVIEENIGRQPDVNVKTRLPLGEITNQDKEIAGQNELYEAGPKEDGLYHCPFVQEGCTYKPEKLKTSYHKHLDTHVKPYRCRNIDCANISFSSTAVLLRHEREAHGMHGHGDKPYLCTYEGCDRSIVGNGFPRRWNLQDHMMRIHDYTGWPTTGDKQPVATGGQAAFKHFCPEPTCPRHRRGYSVLYDVQQHVRSMHPESQYLATLDVLPDSVIPTTGAAKVGVEEPSSPPIVPILGASSLELVNMLDPQDIGNILRTNIEHVMILDVRTIESYSRSHVQGALNLYIAQTLLRRPSHTLQRMSENFIDAVEKALFLRWSEMHAIIVYDARSTDQAQASACQATLRKFFSEGWSGRGYIVKGGFEGIQLQSPHLVQRGNERPGLPSSFSHELAKEKDQLSNVEIYFDLINFRREASKERSLNTLMYAIINRTPKPRRSKSGALYSLKDAVWYFVKIMRICKSCNRILDGSDRREAMSKAWQEVVSRRDWPMELKRGDSFKSRRALRAGRVEDRLKASRESQGTEDTISAESRPQEARTKKVPKFGCLTPDCSRYFVSQADMIRHCRLDHGMLDAHDGLLQEYCCPILLCERHNRGFIRVVHLYEHFLNTHPDRNADFIPSSLRQSHVRGDNTRLHGFVLKPRAPPPDVVADWQHVFVVPFFEKEQSTLEDMVNRERKRGHYPENYYFTNDMNGWKSKHVERLVEVQQERQAELDRSWTWTKAMIKYTQNHIEGRSVTYALQVILRNEPDHSYIAPRPQTQGVGGSSTTQTSSRALDIMVCDANEEARSHLVEMLRTLRCNVTETTTGDKGGYYAIAMKKKLDMIIMDVSSLDVLGAASAVRKNANINQSVPIVIIASHLKMNVVKDMGLSNTINEIIEKPLTVAKLVDVLSTFCEWTPPSVDWHNVSTQETLEPRDQEESSNDDLFDWSMHRGILERLYVTEGLPLSKVKAEMEKHYDFPPMDDKAYEDAFKRLGIFRTTAELVASDRVEISDLAPAESSSQQEDAALMKGSSAYVALFDSVREEFKDRNLSFPDIRQLVDERWQNLNLEERAALDSRAPTKQPIQPRANRPRPNYDVNAPLRPLSSYMFFAKTVEDEFKEQPTLSSTITEIVRKRWQALNPEEREPFEQKSQAAKEEYAIELARYKQTSEYQRYQQYLRNFIARAPTSQKPEIKHKGILRQPRDKFPEDPTPIREGAAPLNAAGKKGIPPNPRWTKIDRRLVDPEALDIGIERFEERGDHVIVLRVLSKEEIEQYAAKTVELREQRRREATKRSPSSDDHDSYGSSFDDDYERRKSLPKAIENLVYYGDEDVLPPPMTASMQSPASRKSTSQAQEVADFTSENTSTDEVTMQTSSTTGVTQAPKPTFAEALFDYSLDEAGFSFHKGDILQILSWSREGWYEGQHAIGRGLFPSTYVRLLKTSSDNPSDSRGTADMAETLSTTEIASGRMHGPVSFRTSNSDNWTSAFCAIEATTGRLLYQMKGYPSLARTLLPDLRGCQVRTHGPKYSPTSYLEVSDRSSETSVRLRPHMADTFESWHMAFLWWQTHEDFPSEIASQSDQGPPISNISFEPTKPGGTVNSRVSQPRAFPSLEKFINGVTTVSSYIDKLKARHGPLPILEAVIEPLASVARSLDPLVGKSDVIDPSEGSSNLSDADNLFIESLNWCAATVMSISGVLHQPDLLEPRNYKYTSPITSRLHLRNQTRCFQKLAIIYHNLPSVHGEDPKQAVADILLANDMTSGTYESSDSIKAVCGLVTDQWLRRFDCIICQEVLSACDGVHPCAPCISRENPESCFYDSDSEDEDEDEVTTTSQHAYNTEGGESSPSQSPPRRQSKRPTSQQRLEVIVEDTLDIGGEHR